MSTGSIDRRVLLLERDATAAIPDARTIACFRRCQAPQVAPSITEHQLIAASSLQLQ
jgi:hypothetical protein